MKRNVMTTKTKKKMMVMDHRCHSDWWGSCRESDSDSSLTCLWLSFWTWTMMHSFSLWFYLSLSLLNLFPAFQEENEKLVRGDGPIITQQNRSLTDHLGISLVDGRMYKNATESLKVWKSERSRGIETDSVITGMIHQSRCDTFAKVNHRDDRSIHQSTSG